MLTLDLFTFSTPKMNQIFVKLAIGEFESATKVKLSFWVFTTYKILFSLGKSSSYFVTGPNNSA